MEHDIFRISALRVGLTFQSGGVLGIKSILEDKGIDSMKFNSKDKLTTMYNLITTPPVPCTQS